jgi:flagellar basal-body rod modification protein FlgD
MSSIYATTSATKAASAKDSSNADTLAAATQKTLTQDDFLKLLIAQMTSQDPMNPVSNQDFMAQMAQFSTLEQTRTLGADIAAMRGDQQILQANALLGQTVELQVDDDTTTRGVVSAVRLSGETPQIVVGGTAYDLSQVLSIQPTAPPVAQPATIQPTAAQPITAQQTTAQVSS